MVVLESPNANKSSQKLCGTFRPNMFHTIHKVFVRNGSEELHCMRATINCGTTRIIVYLGLLEKLSLVDKPAYIPTLGLNEKVMGHSSKSR